MEIKLPKYRSEFEPRITEQAYSDLLQQAIPLMERAIQLYETYCKTGKDDILYPVFGEVVSRLRPKLRTLAYVAWSDMHNLAGRLSAAAEMSVFDIDRPHKATFLYDLAGAVEP